MLTSNFISKYIEISVSLFNSVNIDKDSLHRQKLFEDLGILRE